MRVLRWPVLGSGLLVFITAGILATPILHAQEAELRQRIAALERQVELLQRQVAGRDSAELAMLRRQIEAITREIEELRLGQDVVVRADSGRFGFGPAASKVYGVGQGVSIGGYGEVLYENFADEREDGEPSGRTDQIDALRAIVYVGYKFNDRFLFNSEIEFEHGTTDQAGSVSLEFAYLDWLVAEGVGLRAGLLLVPMGFLNELHEPPTFLGTRRPETEQQIIPSTWRENGLGVFGDMGRFSYRAYLINSFDAIGGGSSNASGFSASGLRGGRQKGSKAIAEDFAGVIRVDYAGLPGFLVGGSLYAGQAGQGVTSPVDPGATVDATTIIWEGHAEYRARGFDLRALFAMADVGDVAEINAVRGLTGPASVGERLYGWYLQAGYDVLRGLPTSQRLVPYARFERLNTQDEVPTGFVADPSTDRSILSLGVAWKPIVQVVLKADYQIHSNDADTGVDQLNVALGYLF